MTPRTRSFFKIIDLRLTLTPLATIYRTFFEGALNGGRFTYLDVYVFGIRVARFHKV